MGGARWMHAEEQVLLENYPRLRIDDLLALLPGRSHPAIANRVKRLRERGHPLLWKWKHRLVNLPTLPYSDVEKAWLACAIECEGTIGIDHNHQVSLSPYIFFGNSKGEIVEHFLKVSRAPVTVFVMRYTDRRKGNWKDQWHVKVRRAPWVYTFLKQVYPYCIIKKEQASLILEFLEIEDQRRSQGLKGYSEREWEIYRAVKALNRRGKSQ